MFDVKTYQKQYREKNKSILAVKRALYFKRYRLENKERRNAYNRKWRKSNPEKVAQHALQQKPNLKRLYIKNRNQRVAYSISWSRKNLTKYRDGQRFHQQKRRALIRKSTINLKAIKSFMFGVLSREISVCYYCKNKILSRSVHFDHIIPLSKGGPHSVENICVSCASCNLSKNDKPFRMWITIGQQLLEL
jgi:5-methylcytosine-specific restriction endonuclease McrA